MTTPLLLPDRVYQKTRLDLLGLETSLFESLLFDMADYYPQSAYDNTIYGKLLRRVSTEMAQIDYAVQYLLISNDPQYLTPADIKRQYAGPLYLTRSYPGKTQRDLDYKAMVLGLIPAYQQGCTVAGIEAVLKAFTGTDYTVDELFKLIGAPGTTFDQSDRNALRIGINLDSSDPTAVVDGVSKVAAVVADLYTAIDLAKPAHVGINLTTVFGEGEALHDYFMGIDDTGGVNTPHLRIILQLVEAAPIEAPLTLGPLLDPNSPDTRLAPEGPGIVSPILGTAWVIKSETFHGLDLD